MQPRTFVPISDGMLQIAIEETAVRLRNYDLLRLPTDLSSGSMTREQRQLGGTLGECALRILDGNPPTGPWSTGLDGGCDYVINGQRINIMTAMGGCRYCYHPDFKPLNCDVIVQAQLCLKPLGVRFLGKIDLGTFNRLKIRRKIGAREYWSVLVDQMEAKLDFWGSRGENRSTICLRPQSLKSGCQLTILPLTAPRTDTSSI